MPPIRRWSRVTREYREVLDEKARPAASRRGRPIEPPRFLSVAHHTNNQDGLTAGVTAVESGRRLGHGQDPERFRGRLTAHCATPGPAKHLVAISEVPALHGDPDLAASRGLKKHAKDYL